MAVGARYMGGMLALGALALLGAAPAAASVSCTNAGGTLTITHSDAPPAVNDVTIRVSGAAIQVLDDGAAVACAGAAPTTANIGALQYNHTGGISDLLLEEPDRLAPGVGGPAEGAGDPEIEVAVSETSGILSDVVVADADDGGDQYRIGDIGLNWNPDEPTPDADLTISGFFPDLSIIGSPATDIADGRGGAGTGPALGTGGFSPLSADLRAGNDQAFGGVDGERFRGGAGDDLLDGGAGNDGISYADSTLPVRIDLAAPGPENAGSFGRDTLQSIEEVGGSDHNDVLLGSDGPEALDGNAGDDLLEGRDGDDFLNGGPGADIASFARSPVAVRVDLEDTEPQPTGQGTDTLWQGDLEFLVGSARNDVLLGTVGINRIFGRNGNDRIFGRGSDDLLNGGRGADRLFGSFGRDLLVGAAGRPDLCNGGGGRDRGRGCERRRRLP